MRDFYIYGFRSRDEFKKKSARSYDNEKRRIESYLGEYVSFRQDQNGKKVFISIDGKDICHNPLYRAFKSKSFTDKDITLHFIIMDILHDGEEYTLADMIKQIDEEYLSYFEKPMIFDESTLRKKMKEYVELGIVKMKKEGRKVLYRITEVSLNIQEFYDAISYFSEENPIGVVGSYLLDKTDTKEDILSYKNHYLMNAYDTEIQYEILKAIREKQWIEIQNKNKYNPELRQWTILPLKLYISTQGGRNYLIGNSFKGKLMSFRIDYIAAVKPLGAAKESEWTKSMEIYEDSLPYTWGVISRFNDRNSLILAGASDQDERKKYNHIELDISVEPNEQFILRRLEREKRCGEIEQIDENIYRFSADVFDAYEMMPWIRTFIGRIVAVRCNNKSVEEQLKIDIMEMMKMYQDA